MDFLPRFAFAKLYAVRILKLLLFLTVDRGRPIAAQSKLQTEIVRMMNADFKYLFIFECL